MIVGPATGHDTCVMLDLPPGPVIHQTPTPIAQQVAATKPSERDSSKRKGHKIWQKWKLESEKVR